LPVSESGPLCRGHPTGYGERFDLKDESSWGIPNDVVHTQYQSQRGRQIAVTITAWHNLLMRGGKAAPMHMGTPAAAPKPRGKSPGRQRGQTQTPRPRIQVVKKGKSSQTKVEDAA